MRIVWFVVVISLRMCDSNKVPDDDALFEIPLYLSCIEPGYEKPCSGHGTCINGSCFCYSLGDINLFYQYTGKYCEECPYCKGQRCKEIFNCFNKCQQDVICNHTCSLKYSIMHNYTTIDRSPDEKLCLIEDENGCFISFKYTYRNDELLIFINDEKECYNGYAIILYAILGVATYILSLFALVHCVCDRCPESKRLSRRSRNVDIVRIPTSLTD